MTKQIDLLFHLFKKLTTFNKTLKYNTMKKLVFILVLVPIFLISSMNFFGGEEDVYHNSSNRSFTCSSCHATIIDGIIVNGKLETDGGSVLVEIDVPENTSGNLMVNIGGSAAEKINSSLVYNTIRIDQYGALLSFDLERGDGKKENKLSIKHEISAIEKAAGFIEIEGVLSNLDNKTTEDYSFYKKIPLEEVKTLKAVSVYPSVTSNTISIDNLALASVIKIFDIQGKMVFKGVSEDEKTTIDLSNFPNGNYFALLGSGENLIQSKFVVSK